MAVTVQCLFLMVPFVGMQCVIVAFPGYTHPIMCPMFRKCLMEILAVIGPHSAVGNVSGYRCVTDCRSRGSPVHSRPGPIL